MDRAISDMDLLRYTQLANNESDTPSVDYSEFLRSQINEVPDLRRIRTLSDEDRKRLENRLGPYRAVADLRLRALSNEDLRNLMSGRIPSNENLDRAFNRLRNRFRPSEERDTSLFDMASRRAMSNSEERDLRAISNSDMDFYTSRLEPSLRPKLYSIRIRGGEEQPIALNYSQIQNLIANYGPDVSIRLVDTPQFSIETPQSTNQGIGSLRSPSPMP